MDEEAQSRQLDDLTLIERKLFSYLQAMTGSIEMLAKKSSIRRDESCEPSISEEFMKKDGERLIQSKLEDHGMNGE